MYIVHVVLLDLPRDDFEKEGYIKLFKPAIIKEWLRKFPDYTTAMRYQKHVRAMDSKKDARIFSADWVQLKPFDHNYALAEFPSIKPVKRSKK